jgi:hypothetical protein
MFDQLACHRTPTAKLWIVSERRGSDEEKYQGQSLCQGRFISRPVSGGGKGLRRPDHRVKLRPSKLGSTATKIQSRPGTTSQVGGKASRARRSDGADTGIGIAQMRRLRWMIAILNHRHHLLHINSPIGRTRICFPVIVACRQLVRRQASSSTSCSVWNSASPNVLPLFFVSIACGLDRSAVGIRPMCRGAGRGVFIEHCWA